MPARHSERTAINPIKRGLIIAITISISICVILVTLTFLILETIMD